ncbi:hypothetical protein AN643_03230 [Candidatus Epulonipiscioides saccharophilum]|nr:hypothetical protein AN643_03230 [Epulopiscium sp. SCG-B10WGA-EpuloB]
MADEYLYLWDTSIGFYEEDGKMVFEPLEEDFKTGIKSYAKWYAEGLIDPEIFTGNKATRDTLLGTNRGGLTHDWQSAGGYNELLADDVPGFNFVGMAPPANQHGNIVERTARTASPGWGISATCEDPVTIIKYFDYIFTEEAQYLTSCGLEGVTYTLNDDGTITYKDLVQNAPEGMLAHLIQYGVNTDIGRRVLATYEIAQMSPSVAATAQMYSDHTEEWYNLDAPAYFDGRMNLKIIPEMEAEYLQIMATVDSYVEEKFQGWILGTSDFDKDYDAFVKELKDRGIDRATEIVQASYDLQYK